MEVAIKTYQTFFDLKVTGKLDADTVKQMSIPRCGVADGINNGSLIHPQFLESGRNPLISHLNSQKKLEMLTLF